MIASIFWDPSREMFSWHIPLLNRPILWYGFLFALGFFLAYGALRIALRRYFSAQLAPILAEKLAFAATLGAVIGARLFDLIFYQDWHALFGHPLNAIKVWEGGLASHGGVVGILIAVWLFTRKYRELSWLRALDFLVPPAALAGACIRIGNFINQEILGRASTLPWAVVFGHPIDASAPIPRHPVQIYEALVYFALFGFLYTLLLRKAKIARQSGRLTGLFLLLAFGARFLLEFFKVEQSDYLAGSWLTMGQILSIPLIGWGFFLVKYRRTTFG